MNAVIKLSDLVETMESQDDESELFVNRINGEILLFSEKEITIAEGGDDPERFPQWQREIIALANAALDSDDYIEMGAAHEIDDYAMMRDFCDSISDPVIADQLNASIRGRGAFHHFRKSVDELDLQEQWLAFKYQAYESAAIAWCKENNIDYS
ncbi:MAG: UPF0158 family protein [Pseudomonadota bacterium]|nr:UPF0158 family protein [Pseudomonadota bacterium]